MVSGSRDGQHHSFVFYGKAPACGVFRAGHSFMKAERGSVKVCPGITMYGIYANNWGILMVNIT
jgi:hypothetical protein